MPKLKPFSQNKSAQLSLSSILAFAFTIVLTSSCGGEKPPLQHTTAHKSPSSSPVKEEQPITHQSTMWNQSEETGRNCEVDPQPDGTKMLFSDENDWYFYVSESATVNCSKMGGKVEVTDSSSNITLLLLTPLGNSNEKTLVEEFSHNHLKKLKAIHSLPLNATFQWEKLGNAKRNAFCLETEFKKEGSNIFLVSCITAKTNANDDVLTFISTHFNQIKKKKDKTHIFKAVAKSSVEWFRNSDTDANGALINLW